MAMYICRVCGWKGEQETCERCGATAVASRLTDVPAAGAGPSSPAPAVALRTGGQLVVSAETYARQNLGAGLVAGALAAIACAGLWAAITVASEMQIGWMAVGVGLLVGLAVRAAGRGLTPGFGVAGAVLALFGCLLGNLLSVCGFFAKQEDVAFLDVLSHLDPSLVVELLQATFSPMDLLFYGIAVYEGFRLSFVRVGTVAAPA